MRGDQFYDIVKEAQLNIQYLKPSEQRACTYDQKPITLDGQIDMMITFSGKTIMNTVFVKLVAPDKLLLSENVCQMLGVVSYHPDVQPVGSARVLNDPATKDKQDALKPANSGVVESNQDLAGDGSRKPDQGEKPLQKVVVETYTSSVAVVKLLSAVRLPAYHSAVVPVQVKGVTGSVLIEQCETLNDCLCIDQSLVEAKEDGVTTLWVTNNGKTTYQLQTGVELAEACEVDLELDNEVTVTPEETLCEVHEKLGESSPITNSTETDTSIPITDDLRLWIVSSLTNGNTFSKEHITWWQQQLISSLVDVERKLSEEECLQLRGLLADYHDIFSLNDDEHGKTDLVEFKIGTGEAYPRRQPAQRVPFSARREITKQLEKMQRDNVIQPSENPWASPVVLVRKRDGSLHFCVDYRALNSVT